ncbi:MAG: hypothetical protein GTO63_12235 [Anaerolineae bacterium]|nr:hypothetical protein [Anaerolineae bacterium]NIN95665.1 hypothetical protein [Anaerolineae bacterium]NIQ78620.1 hypothetical protein [Anaerolineae bacterium]
MSKSIPRKNKGKNRLALMSFPALWELARVYTMGAKKYEARAWEQGMSYTETLDSALRHIWLFAMGHTADEDPPHCHPLAHAIWNLVALLHYELNESGCYDQFKDLSEAVYMPRSTEE